MNAAHPFSHSSHDYTELVARWRDLGESVGCPALTLIEGDGRPVLYLERESKTQPAIYLSAGVHGDECAPVWALLQWAEANRKWLQENPFLIFPCLNPHGLIENTRTDQNGRDLNRCFDDADVPIISAWQRLVRNKVFSQCLNLHEDYDARGIYLYEIAEEVGGGQQILASCQHIIDCDRRAEIDGHPFIDGLATHESGTLEQVIEEELGGGYPEAIFLALHHSSACYTFETPSELDISARVSAHRAALDSAIHRSTTRNLAP
ncbi:MAG: M14 family metallocarboxypeptidase [Verrucomicrobiota bacterium]